MITNQDVLQSIQALTALKGMNVPGKLAYAIARNITKVNAIARDFEAARLSVLTSFQTNDDGSIPEELQPEAQSKIVELLQADSGIKPYMIKPEWFDTVNLETDLLLGIIWMIESDQ